MLTPALTSMLGLAKSDDYQPIGWMGRYPIHVATLLVLLHVVTMIGTAFAISLGRLDILGHLIFASNAVLGHLALWQFFTYAFVNRPSVWFAVEMFLLYSFGREVERFIGRRSFGALYMMLLLLPPCLATAAGTFMPTSFAGSSALHFAVFVAFTAIYPNIELLFTIKAKWIAGALFSVFSLQQLAANDWTSLAVLWISTGAAFAFIARLRYGVNFSPFALLRRLRFTRKLKPLAQPRRIVPRKITDEDTVSSIDPILDKISQHGIASLTLREREKLERARSALMKKTST